MMGGGGSGRGWVGHGWGWGAGWAGGTLQYNMWLRDDVGKRDLRIELCLRVYMSSNMLPSFASLGFGGGFEILLNRWTCVQ